MYGMNAGGTLTDVELTRRGEQSQYLHHLGCAFFQLGIPVGRLLYSGGSQL
jgi:hypothetical protein